jgi:LysM repeat protein
MSAVATSITRHAVGARAPRAGARPARHLVSVPTGDAVPTHLRITRRGRLALTGLAAATLVATGVGVADAGSSSPEPVTVTVTAGETLGEIAARHMPEVPTSAAVARLRSANGLSTPFVHSGQELVIPTR